jgi:hypothetical protein
MSLLAIDPGPIISAYCCFDLAHGVPESFATVTNDEMLAVVENRAGSMAIEMIASYGMPVGKEVFETCLWIGRFIERWLSTGRPEPTRITRHEVKLHLCHSARAKDSNIAQALKDRFGDKGTKKTPGILYGIKGDEWAALAVAVTQADRSNQLVVA